jgi:hypothetical protein
VEIFEKMEEHHRLSDAVPTINFREAAVVEKRHHPVQTDADKLDHL